ncbi:long-chain fatty acid--CoA ligase [Flavobacteriales bacterium]|nr:long-chain fatty acid--CoA ligase [Flavobacteriales bacterium]
MVHRLFDISCASGKTMLFNHLHKGELISYSRNEVELQSDILACQLIKSGLRKRSRIVSLLKDGPIWNIAECAILKAGGVHVPLPVTTDSEKLKRILMMVIPTTILVDSDAAAHARLENEDLTDLKHRKDSVEPDDTAVILFSSGSTTSSKGVLLSNRNIPVAAEEFGNSDVFNNVQRSLSVLPVRHSAARKVNYACQFSYKFVCFSFD